MTKETRGRKTNKAKGIEKKKSYNVYLFPSAKSKLIKKYKSLTKAIETLIN